MDYVEIINIVAYVLCVVLFALALFFRVKGKTVGAVSELIAMAESTELLGHEKMALVVSNLYDRVPAAFRGILTKEVLEKIAQGIFDWMRKYANAFVAANTDGSGNELTETNAELMDALVQRLVALSPVALRGIAISLGVDVAGMSDEDVVKAILVACFKKS